MNKKEKIFAAIAGILAILSVVFGFITWCYSQMVPFIVHSDLISGYSFIIHFIKAVITPLLSQIIGYLPAVLFAVYALFLYRKNKNSKLLPISFVFAIISGLWSIASTLISFMRIYPQVEEIRYLLSFLPSIVISLIMIAISVVLAVDGFTNFKLSVISKIAVVLKLVISLGSVCISGVTAVINVVGFIDRGYGWKSILQTTSYIPTLLAALIFPIALVIFYFGCVKKPKKEEVSAEEQIQE